MSRHLPWGETIHNDNSLWKGYTYPSEPIEIGENEWFRGFLEMIERKTKDEAD